MKRRLLVPALPTGPRGYTSFDPRDSDRECRITRAQVAIARYRDARLGWRAGVEPRTRLAFRLIAAWWRLEPMRDHGVTDRARSAEYAANMRWAAERVGDRALTWRELRAEITR